MTNAYCDLEILKAEGALNISGALYDQRLLGLLEQASRWIDGYCNRAFYVLAATREFDGGGSPQLLLPDLIGVTALQTRQSPNAAPQTWPPDRYQLYPANAAPEQPWGRPYTWVGVHPAALPWLRFPQGPGSVRISGRWGFRSVKTDSGTTLESESPLTPAATQLTAATAGKLSPGQTLEIGQEQLYVTAVESVTATVLRGVNGTAAAAHNGGAPIALYQYPGPVTEACLQLTAQLWHRRDRFALPGGNSNGDVIPGPEITNLLASYRKLALGG